MKGRRKKETQPKRTGEGGRAVDHEASGSKIEAARCRCAGWSATPKRERNAAVDRDSDNRMFLIG